MDVEYSKRELDEKFADIKEDLSLILAQTTKHNGRLTSVERYIYTIMGAVGILGFLMGAKLLTFLT